MRKYEDEEKGRHGMRLALMVLIDQQFLFSISQAIKSLQSVWLHGCDAL